MTKSERSLIFEKPSALDLIPLTFCLLKRTSNCFVALMYFTKLGFSPYDDIRDIAFHLPNSSPSTERSTHGQQGYNISCQKHFHFLPKCFWIEAIFDWPNLQHKWSEVPHRCHSNGNVVKAKECQTYIAVLLNWFSLRAHYLQLY